MKFPEAAHSKTCLYITGEPSSDTCCGQARKPGSVYCPEHHEVCYTRARKEVVDMAGVREAVGR